MGKIIASAIKHRGVVFTGVRHGVIMQELSKLNLLDGYIHEEQQGFIDEDGHFMSREAARELAVDLGIIPANRVTLYSEDIWPDDPTQVTNPALSSREGTK